MTDTGQIPGEGLPENAGMVEQPGVPAHGAYTYLSETTAEDEDLLLLPGAQGAWGNEVAPPAPEPVVEAVHEPGPHETAGRDSGSHDLSAVRPSQPQRVAPSVPIPPVTPRRPLHLGPPTPDASASPVRSLADRGPAGAPVRQSGPPTVGPEYLDVPQQLREMSPQGATPWTAPASVGAAAPTAETVVPVPEQAPQPVDAAQAAVARLVTDAVTETAAPQPQEAVYAGQAAVSADGVPGAGAGAAYDANGQVPVAGSAPEAGGEPEAGQVPGSGVAPMVGVPDGGGIPGVGEVPADGGIPVAAVPGPEGLPGDANVLGSEGVPGAVHVPGADGAPAGAGVSVSEGAPGDASAPEFALPQETEAAYVPDASGIPVAAQEPDGGLVPADVNAPAPAAGEVPDAGDGSAVLPAPEGGEAPAAGPLGDAGQTPGHVSDGEAGLSAGALPGTDAEQAAVPVAGVDAGQAADGLPLADAAPGPDTPQATDLAPGLDTLQATAAAPGAEAGQNPGVASPAEATQIPGTVEAGTDQAPSPEAVGTDQVPGAVEVVGGDQIPGLVEADATDQVPGPEAVAPDQIASPEATGADQAVGALDVVDAGQTPGIANVADGTPLPEAAPVPEAPLAPEAAEPQAVAVPEAPAPEADQVTEPAAVAVTDATDPQVVPAPEFQAPGTELDQAATPAAVVTEEAAPNPAQLVDAAVPAAHPGQAPDAAAPAPSPADPTALTPDSAPETAPPAPEILEAVPPFPESADAEQPQPPHLADAEGTAVVQPEASAPAAIAERSAQPEGTPVDPTQEQTEQPALVDAAAAPDATAQPLVAEPAGPQVLFVDQDRPGAEATAVPQPLGQFVPVEGTVPTTPHLAPTPPQPLVLPAQEQPAVPGPRDGDGDPELVQHADDLDTRAADQEESTAPVEEVRQSTGPAAPAYDDAEREAVLKVMRERRDIRNGFRSDPIPHEVLLRVLEAAHTAPSVGHSQPWDFVVIRSADTRRTMHELAMRQRDAYAKSLPKGRAKQFKELKIEAILDTPVNIVVTADPTRGGRHTLGRHTQPQMAPYSSALAVENLWLAARAEGLGVGWVSFFDEREMVRALGLPEHLEVVAYLCVGYVDEFPDEPELLQAGWSKRRPLSWVVHEETYGRRALPGEEPHDLLAETVAQIRPLDAKALGEAWERQKRMTKPAGALGMLEIISAQLSGLSRQCPPPIPEPAAVAIFAGDHGVHAQGVTPWPQEVTAQMVANFLGGGAVCNAFAGQVGAEVCVVDVGVAADLPATPGLLPRKVRAGTSDMTTGPAMTREEAQQAIEVGIETARDLVAAGNKALLTGEMGIANTTASAALISVFTDTDPAEVTGRGTGINDETLARKTEVVRRAIEVHQPDPADPIGVLAAIGGFEHAAMVGLLLGGASLRTPVILDGVSAGAAALVARAIAPEVLAACIAGHRSAEPGHVAALNKLGLRPLVDLDLRLGEGTGALLALPLVQSTARAMHEVATFDSAGVTEK
ncbi:nicotinate-nucleotide--dimethylbenzimidazole phosphoribosyltransferase [Streptomyces sp. S.PB5]|uniref:nicotinate-nucleotide--dimethylbenzimidazole phosphoribosyltransferase n=1 Tax=Streptomyces sp. S.PB5 TaxID=3020844 RepID=UPI0025AF7FA2|nr:nicotinate-nucleotide--dimethylbenzimidazole phosphoribosyltransferase [Streptomyces sp. S.PB5]MDN3022330.1 nicotinate-nucleotide--dimethylbenzimidazole phosphoribosyltransferase [Streptomyces sp. S.PB5]